MPHVGQDSPHGLARVVSHRQDYDSPMPRFTLPDEPPSARILPEHERRQRAADLEWMHEAAAPRRKKRVDPAPEPVADRQARQYRDALGGFHELED